ncbi:SusD family protein [bacterium A37T11]|nr:SusD family protein [bacterium A37T11]
MKNYQSTVLLLICAAALLTSCKKWLDVDSDTNVVQEILFDKHDGFYTAVNGVYLLLGQPELYARELTWGAASALGNNYDISTASKVPKKYVNLATKDYSTSDNIATTDPIWEKGYNVIANCNNILSHLEQKDSSFFPLGQLEKDLIQGEMLGVRAMMHFDLLRLYAPAPKADDGKLYIPYVSSYPQKATQHLTVQATLDNIIRDLEQAKTLLAKNDTLDNTNNNVMKSLRYRFITIIDNLPGGLFFSYRGYRMNYVAASALLARIYLWRDNTGDKAKAYDCANSVYHLATDEGWFTFTSSYNLQTSDPNNIYRKMFDDVLLSAYNNTLPDIYTATKSFNEAFTLSNTTTLFGSDLDDFRLLYLMDGTTSKISRRWEPIVTTATLSQEVAAQTKMAPIIRLSEMYYTLCECLAETDLPKAIQLLSTLRTARGAKAPLTVSSKAEFLELLYNDMTREFMTEGQTFFLYKRLNRPIFNGAVPLDMTGRYVLPLPHSEDAYINL